MEISEHTSWITIWIWYCLLCQWVVGKEADEALLAHAVER